MLVKIVNKPLNLDRLADELAPLRAITTRVDWYGFERQDARTMVPIPARRKVGEANGVLDFADPGEIRFHLTRDLTAQEEAALDAALAAHDAKALSAEQVREDRDESDLDQLLAGLANFDTFLANFDNAGNVNQLKAALRPFCVNVGKALRLIARKYRGAAV